MYGIVLWADRLREKAVVWCADHADLAYISSFEPEAEIERVPEPGSFIAFQIKDVGETRYCIDIRMLEPNAAPGLAKMLKGAAKAFAAEIEDKNNVPQSRAAARARFL